MSARPHSPGPWQSRAPRPSANPSHVVLDAEGHYVAHVEICAHNPARADLALIAAAPDLLAALRAMRDRLVGMADGPLRDTTAESWLRYAVADADTAIAKAEGRA